MIGQTVNAFTHWLESCPCHSSTLAFREFGKLTKYFRKKALAGDYGRSHDPDDHGIQCPNLGRWAPEFAAGRWLDILQQLFATGQSEILVITQNGMSAEQTEKIMSEWTRGKLQLVEFCTKKFAFWKELPYSLCALGLEDLTEARRILQEGYGKYLATQGAVHHRITRLFFANGDLLQELLLFFQGRKLSDLPLVQLWHRGARRKRN